MQGIRLVNSELDSGDTDLNDGVCDATASLEATATRNKTGDTSEFSAARTVAAS
jgi:hypothetical protein